MELKKLLDFKDDEQTLQRLLNIKKMNKVALKNHLRDMGQVKINENSIFDIQVKRLHEYKRQQMNALYVIYKYREIKNGNLPAIPITVIFGAKAAPAYTIAKDIIHLILCLQELVNGDPEVSPYLNVVMVENYNVSWAEKLIPACDVSEQISLASQEASGTGNMKFMLNGAVTLGTEDGANVEIHELVGDENIYIFGETSDEVIKHYEKVKLGDSKRYKPVDYYLNDDLVKELLDFMVGREMLGIGDPESLLRLHKEILVKDWFMTLLDLKEYIEVKEKVFVDYENRKDWARKMLVNIANAGYFSSDRTIGDYNRDIWKL
jgi:starch phosphorylase